MTWRQQAVTDTRLRTATLLDTFGIPHAILERPDDVHLIPEYYRLSRQRKGPAVVLVGLETIWPWPLERNRPKSDQ